MRRTPHENVATVLVDPRVLGDLELDLMALDLRVWPVRTAPICMDGARMEFQVRRKLLMRHGDAWHEAARWVPVWVGFGPSWRQGDDPLPWAAHEALWRALAVRGGHVRFQRRLGGVPRLRWPEELAR